MDKLLNYIEHYYKGKIVSPTLSYDEENELKFLEDFVYKMTDDDSFTILDLDMHDLVTAYLCAYSEGEIFERIKKRIDALDIQKIGSYDIIFRLNDLYKNFLDKNCFRELEIIPYEYDTNSPEYIKIKENDLLNDLHEIHKLLKQSICQTEEQRKIYFEVYEKYSKNLIMPLIAVGALNMIKKDASNMVRFDKKKKLLQNFDFKSIKPSNELVTKSSSPFSPIQGDLSDKLVAILEVTHIEESITDMQKKINELKKIPVKKEKENKNINRKMNKVIDIIKSLDFSKPIDLTKGMYESITDERIKYIILRYLLMHNLSFQEKTIERLEKEENISKLEKLFKKSCFSFDDLDSNMRLNLSLYGNIDDIEKMLNIFTESRLKIYNNSFPIYEVLLLSRPSIVSSINKLITGNVISQEFALANPSIFVQDIDEEQLKLVDRLKKPNYDNLINNINQLKERKINTLTISNSKSCNLLIKDNEDLNNVLYLMENYQLDFSNSDSYSLLENPNLIRFVDRFIELGLSEFIKNNPSIINMDTNILLERMELYKALGVELVKDGILLQRITGGYFKIGKNIISDNDLKNYIPNSIYRYMDSECFKAIEESTITKKTAITIEELKCFEENELEYSFNGITISRQKVLRNMAILDEKCPNIDRKTKIFNSLIYGSVLDEEKLTLISQIINDSMKKLEKK